MALLQAVLTRNYLGSHPAAVRAREALQADVGWAKKLQLTGVLAGHDGCVNSVRWDAAGGLLCSGSDDRTVRVWDRSGALRETRRTLHVHNIFDAAFVPRGGGECVTAAADGRVCRLYGGGRAPDQVYASRDYGVIASKLAFVPGTPAAFLVAFSDARVRLFDLRARGHAVVLDLDGVPRAPASSPRGENE